MKNTLHATLVPALLTARSGKPDEALASADDPSAKVSAYIGCCNRVDGRAMQSMERYASRVANMKTAPAGRERMVDGLCALGDNAVRDCLKDVGALTPAMENFYAAGLARVEKAAALMVSFEKAADATLAYAKAHEGGQPMWSAFESSIEPFLVAAKKRVRRVRGKKLYNQGERMMLEGSGTARPARWRATATSWPAAATASRAEAAWAWRRCLFYAIRHLERKTDFALITIA